MINIFLLIFFKLFSIFISSLSIPIVTSYKYKIIFAEVACLRAFSFPSFSIVSLVSLIPAVSNIVTGKPSKLNILDTTSLVVPACLLTMETSSSVRKFIKEDLPVFGLPITATLLVSNNNLFFSNFLINTKISSLQFFIWDSIVFNPSISISSSEKSKRAST